MEKLNINFVDFWEGFDSYCNFFVEVLSKRYTIEITDSPDFLIFSTFGYENLKYDQCVKIFYTGENVTPDFNVSDYAIGFDFISFGDRYLRLPLYVLYGIEELARPKVLIPDAVLNRKFCSFVVSNGNGAPERSRFFELLSEYKQVDSGGRYKNNIGAPVSNKREFISGYKFNIAFENNMCDGYTTEKIMEPMLVNSLPIYWGNRLVGLDFNSEAFVNVSDYPSLEDIVERIVFLDNNDKEYLDILSKPCLNESNYLNWEERLLNFFGYIVDKPVVERKYLSFYGYGDTYRTRLRRMLKCQQDKEAWLNLFRPKRWFE